MNQKESARCRETNLENDILVVFELNHHVSRLPVHIPRLNQLYFFDYFVSYCFILLIKKYPFFSPFNIQSPIEILLYRHSYNQQDISHLPADTF